MPSMNRATLMGHLGNDPEVINTQSGSMIGKFSLATTEKWKDRNTGDKKERTEWHRCVCFVEHINNFLSQYVQRGDLVYVEGSIETRKWEDQSGNDRYSTEIVIRPYSGRLDKIKSAGDGNGSGRGDNSGRRSDYGGAAGAKGNASGSSGSSADGLDDDIPF